MKLYLCNNMRRIAKEKWQKKKWEGDTFLSALIHITIYTCIMTNARHRKGYANSSFSKYFQHPETKYSMECTIIISSFLNEETFSNRYSNSSLIKMYATDSCYTSMLGRGTILLMIAAERYKHLLLKGQERP
jgi:hypothetical protein